MPAKRKSSGGGGGGGAKKAKPEVFQPTPQVVDASNLPPGTFYSCAEVGATGATKFAGVEVDTTDGEHLRIGGAVWKHPAYKVPDQVREEITASASHVLDVMLDATKSHIFWVKYRKVLTDKQIKEGVALGDVREMYAQVCDSQPELRRGYTHVMEVVLKNGKPVKQKRVVNNRTVQQLKFDGIHWHAKGIK